MNLPTGGESLIHYMNPFHPSVAFHVETNHLICTANQMTGFSMKYNTGPKWVNSHFRYKIRGEWRFQEQSKNILRLIHG